MQTPFDPRSHLRTLEDGSHYLDLKWRLVWLRSEHPDAIIETQVVPSPDGMVTCRATITLANGASSSGHGAALADVAGEQAVEQAEDRALLRALSALGYGTEFDGAEEVEPEVTSAPPVSLLTARELVEQEQEYEPEPATPEPTRETDQPDASPPEAEDYSWTKFWEWARTRGYRNASQLQEVLGIDDIRAHTPLEVRRMLKRYELEHPPS